MAITKINLLKQLLGAITNDEWEKISHNGGLPVSAFNRNVLLEMREANIVGESDAIQEDDVAGLHKVIEDYLAVHLCDKPDGWKWIIISSIYLTYIAERPMHPMDLLGIREITEDGKQVYECPCKSNDKNTTCYYCVCRRSVRKNTNPGISDTEG